MRENLSLTPQIESIMFRRYVSLARTMKWSSLSNSLLFNSRVPSVHGSCSPKFVYHVCSYQSRVKTIACPVGNFAVAAYTRTVSGPTAFSTSTEHTANQASTEPTPSGDTVEKLVKRAFQEVLRAGDLERVAKQAVHEALTSGDLERVAKQAVQEALTSGDLERVAKQAVQEAFTGGNAEKLLKQAVQDVVHVAFEGQKPIVHSHTYVMFWASIVLALFLFAYSVRSSSVSHDSLCDVIKTGFGDLSGNMDTMSKLVEGEFGKAARSSSAIKAGLGDLSANMDALSKLVEVEFEKASVDRAKSWFDWIGSIWR